MKYIFVLTILLVPLLSQAQTTRYHLGACDVFKPGTMTVEKFVYYTHCCGDSKNVKKPIWIKYPNRITCPDRFSRCKGLGYDTLSDQCGVDTKVYGTGKSFTNDCKAMDSRATTIYGTGGC